MTDELNKEQKRKVSKALLIAETTGFSLGVVTVFIGIAIYIAGIDGVSIANGGRIDKLEQRHNHLLEEFIKEKELSNKEYAEIKESLGHIKGLLERSNK